MRQISQYLLNIFIWEKEKEDVRKIISMILLQAQFPSTLKMCKSLGAPQQRASPPSGPLGAMRVGAGLLNELQAVRFPHTFQVD